MAATAAILKMQKSRYLCNVFTDRHKIWYGDAIQHSWRIPQKFL